MNRLLRRLDINSVNWSVLEDQYDHSWLISIAVIILWLAGYYYLLRKKNQIITTIPITMLALVALFGRIETLFYLWKCFLVWSAALSAIQTRRLTAFFYLQTAAFLYFTFLYYDDFLRYCSTYFYAVEWLFSKKPQQWTISLWAFIPAMILFMARAYESAVLRPPLKYQSGLRLMHMRYYIPIVSLLMAGCFFAAPFWIFNFIPVAVSRTSLSPFPGLGRGTVSRVRSDMRSLATAIEAYYIDNNSYPAWTRGSHPDSIHSGVRNLSGIHEFQSTFARHHPGGPNTLTMPIGYITSYPRDPFTYPGLTFSFYSVSETLYAGWILWSPGPDGFYNIMWPRVETIYDPTVPQPSDILLHFTYDPSNGTDSRGDVWRVKQ